MTLYRVTESTAHYLSLHGWGWQQTKLVRLNLFRRGTKVFIVDFDAHAVVEDLIHDPTDRILTLDEIRMMEIMPNNEVRTEFLKTGFDKTD